MNEELTPETMEDENADVLRNHSAEDVLTKKDIVEKLRQLLASGDLSRLAVDALKQDFYKIQRRERAASENAESPADELEDEMKQILAQIKEKRQQILLAQQQKEAASLTKKTRIIERLQELVPQADLAENVSALVMEVRQLQQEWKAAGDVPAERKNDVNKAYQRYIEDFYDYIKISNDLREYDLKKNLEAKTALCEKAEKLMDEQDIQKASKILQTLHKEWVETGPVARDIREDLWNRFKEATSKLNKKHQQFFEDRKNAEKQNLEDKTALCEKAESIDTSALKTFKDWEAKTKEIAALQEAWKEIGFVPPKAKIYDRFRAACNEFFKHKNEFFKQVKSELSQNLAKKLELCEKAEALKDSTDWKETADKLIKLQKEWKQIGVVGRKQSDAVWKRFSDACDAFFSRRNQRTSEEQNAQKANLKAKQEIIERIKSLAGDDGKQMLDDLKTLMGEWNAVGHVPFGKKDDLYEKYRKALDEKFDLLHTENQNQRLQTFKIYAEGLTDDRELDKLFRRLQKELERLTLDIASYENNMSFFSFDSKKADGLKKEMEKNVERLKNEKTLLQQKLQMLREKLK